MPEMTYAQILERFKQTLFRSNLGQAAVIGNCHTSSAGCRWLVALYCHVIFTPFEVLRECCFLFL